MSENPERRVTRTAPAGAQRAGFTVLRTISPSNNKYGGFAGPSVQGHCRAVKARDFFDIQPLFGVQFF